MSEYKRFTKKDKYGHCYTDTKINDRFMWSKDGKVWERDLSHYAFDGEAIDRLSELEDKIESGLLVELPCRVGDTVYGVDFTECQNKYATTKKEKRKIFNECVTRSADCDKCKYSIPAVHKFVCTQIQIAEEKYTFVVGAKCENYRFENVFLTQEAAEARLKELQEEK